MLDLDLQGGGMKISDKYRACMKIEDRRQSAAKEWRRFWSAMRRLRYLFSISFDLVLDIAIPEQNKTDICLAK
jgi:hypothetical protein